MNQWRGTHGGFGSLNLSQILSSPSIIGNVCFFLYLFKSKITQKGTKLKSNTLLIHLKNSSNTKTPTPYLPHLHLKNMSSTTWPPVPPSKLTAYNQSSRHSPHWIADLQIIVHHIKYSHWFKIHKYSFYLIPFRQRWLEEYEDHHSKTMQIY